MPIRNKAQYDLVKSELAAEIQKPEKDQDIAFINEAVKQLRDASQFMSAQQQPAPAMPMGDQLGRVALGAGDVALSSVNHLINDNAARLMGIKEKLGSFFTPGADPNAYERGKNKYLFDNPSYDPTTPEGQAMAGGMQSELEKYGVPQVMQLTKKASEAVIGKDLTDIGAGALSLATMKTPGRALELPAAAVAAKKAGYILAPDVPLSPTQFAGTRRERLAAGVASTARIDDAISMKNQPVTQQLAAKDAGLPAVTPVTVDQAWDVANQAYDAIKAVPGVVQLPLPKYQSLLDRINALGDNLNKFKDPVAPEVEQLRRTLKTVNGAEVKDFIDKSRELRKDSSTNFKNSKAGGGVELERLSAAQRDAADILDDAVAAHLQEMAASAPTQAGKQQLLTLHSAYMAARKQLSTLHLIRDSMNSTTGIIDPEKVFQLSKQYTLPPGLQTIADTHELTGGLGMRVINKAARGASTPLTAADAISLGYAGSAAGAGAGLAYAASGSPWWAAVIGSVAPMAVRLAGRAYALRGPGARAVGRGVMSTARGGARALALEQQLPDEEQQ